MIDLDDPALSVRRQCELLGLNRSSLSYEPAGATPENLRLMRLIDEQYTARPFFGSRRMTAWLVEHGEEVNRKRVQPLMRTMGLEAIPPKPRLSTAGKGPKTYPTCCEAWRSSGRTRSGVPTSPTCLWSGGSCTWRP